ncbi:predicted protein [Coccidioides posadasii str. Silveira]|uniref:Predicted protein n=1 Tax=Coccidioides posadasii (strain RMSCC 757 / Silveira) TaxID=443226 RepID=E9CR18_COCPS|nr:predicted protein [Coccidioides posadasii str. Silveira]
MDIIRLESALAPRQQGNLTQHQLREKGVEENLGIGAIPCMQGGALERACAIIIHFSLDRIYTNLQPLNPAHNLFFLLFATYRLSILLSRSKNGYFFLQKLQLASKLAASSGAPPASYPGGPPAPLQAGQQPRPAYVSQNCSKRP